jgi:hypothetical protein
MENQSSTNYHNQLQQPVPNSTAVLVLGIVSIIGCFCYGVIGIVCAVIALILSSKANALIRQNPGAFTEGSVKNLNAGRICAIIGLILSLLYIAMIIFGLAYFGLEMLTNPEEFFKKYD